MRKLTQRSSLSRELLLRRALPQWQRLCLFFLSICISFPIFSKDIYIKYDPTCLDRYVYRMNGNQVGGGLIAYSLEGADGIRVMLEVGVESIRKVKVAPKGTQSCKWVNVNEKFARDFNSGRNRLFIVRPVGGYYTVSSVHLATYTKAVTNGVYVAGNGYDFEYREDPTGYIPNNLGGMNSGSTFMYLTTSQFQCNPSYTVKQIPIETCKPTIDLTIIPSIGIIEEKRDVAAFSKNKDILRLESINSIPLDRYIDGICNPRQPEPPREVIVEAPRTEVLTTKAPPVITYEVTERVIPTEYQPAEAEILFKHEMVEKFVPVAACQNASSPGIHVVQPQETLFGIARKYQLNTADIRQWNNLQGATLQPCMELKILPPAQKSEILVYKKPAIECTQTSSPGIHVVQPEETINGIAGAYGITVNDIYTWNNISQTNAIQACTILKVSPPEIVVPEVICSTRSTRNVHIIQPKENLTDIANRYNISVQDIYTWNNLSNKDLIHPCSALKIAPPNKVVVEKVVVEKTIIKCGQTTIPGMHIVQPKQTLTEVAKLHKVSINDIYKWNNLTNKDLINACSALKVAPPTKPVFVEKSVIVCGENSRPGLHIVQPKENLTEISKKYNVSISDIYKWNKLSNKDKIPVCLALKVAPPQQPATVFVEKSVIICGENSRPGVHIVQPKETLTDISKKYNISINDIYKWNRLSNKDIIPVCRALNISLPKPAAQPQNIIVEKTIIRCGEYSRPGIHIVQPKETLSEIATRYNLAIGDIYKWNKLSNKDVIQVCAALKIAPPKKVAPPKTIIVEKTIVRCGEVSRPGVHIVQPKETLSGIASQYNLSIADIYKWNKLSNKDIIPACAALNVAPPKQTPAPKTIIVEKTVVRCGEASRPGVHIVQPKETLSEIASRYNLSIADIYKWNKLSNKDIIPACAALKITPPKQPQAPKTVIVERTVVRCGEASRPGVHIIQPKETLSEIASRYNLSISDLYNWNKLSNKDVIPVCTALKIAPPRQAPAPKTVIVEKTVVKCGEESRQGVHIVQPQQTLTDIAARYFISIEDLRKWNSISNKDIIPVCTALKVKPPTITPTGTCDQSSYRGIHIVQPRETLSEIARRYAVGIDQLRSWNDLTKGEIIKKCTALKVAPPIVNCGERSRPGIHVVQIKENISMIARQYNVSVDDIRKWNDLDAKDIIITCTPLRVAPSQPTAYKAATACSERSSYGLHVVQPKENITEIASRYNLSIDQIRKWNKLNKVDKIYPCTKLRVAPPNVVNNNGDFLIPAGVNYTNSNKDQLTAKDGNNKGWLSGNCIHIVKSGETLSEISALYGYTVDRFRFLNKLKNADIIMVGQQLKTTKEDCADIPARQSTKGTPAPYQDRASHIVRNNETLSSIAKKYNLTVEELRRLNGLRGDIILPNTRLYVR